MGQGSTDFFRMLAYETGDRSGGIIYYIDTWDYVHETDAAWLLRIDGVEMWFPKSRIEFMQPPFNGMTSEQVIMVCEEWLAETKEVDWKTYSFEV